MAVSGVRSSWLDGGDKPSRSCMKRFRSLGPLLLRLVQAGVEPGCAPLLSESRRQVDVSWSVEGWSYPCSRRVPTSPLSRSSGNQSTLRIVGGR